MICPNCRNEVGEQAVCPCCGMTLIRPGNDFDRVYNSTLPIVQPFSNGAEEDALSQNARGAQESRQLAEVDLQSKLCLVLGAGSFIMQLIILGILLFQ